MPPEKGVKPCLCGAATGDQHSSERGTQPPLNPDWLPLHQARRWFLGLFDDGLGLGSSSGCSEKGPWDC